VQLMPEAMDLFAAGISDRAGILYQSTASMAPPPSVRKLAPLLLRPLAVVSSALFSLLYGITSRIDSRYPCAPVTVDRGSAEFLRRAFGSAPGPSDNDGVVPLSSQAWGKIVWAGHADHLDVLGHFHDTAGPALRGAGAGAPPHVDWLSSGSSFERADFDALMDVIVAGIVRSGRDRRAGLREAVRSA
jgi:triacylglycerol lipase